MPILAGKYYVRRDHPPLLGNLERILCSIRRGDIISIRRHYHGLWNAGDRHDYALGSVLEVGIHPLSV
jgi:hypothetical protein